MLPVSMRPPKMRLLRCAPQVMGAAREAVAFAKSLVEIEMNSATDNPLIFPDGPDVLSGGNFHG